MSCECSPFMKPSKSSENKTFTDLHYICFFLIIVDSSLAEDKCYEIPVDSFITPQRVYIDGIRVTPVKEDLEESLKSNERRMSESAIKMAAVNENQYCAVTDRISRTSDITTRNESTASSVFGGNYKKGKQNMVLDIRRCGHPLPPSPSLLLSLSLSPSFSSSLFSSSPEYPAPSIPSSFFPDPHHYSPSTYYHFQFLVVIRPFLFLSLLSRHKQAFLSVLPNLHSSFFP